MSNADFNSGPLERIERASLPERQFQRIAIVNRGEVAIRLIHAVRELNHERQLSVSTVALFTENERRAMFVREADDAVCIGPAEFIDRGDKDDEQQRSSYLNPERIEQALLAARADAAWVGWGPLAEKDWFADLCERLGIVFIGPDAQTLRLLRDRMSVRQLAQQANVPLGPWSGPIETETEAKQWAERLGYPLLIKPMASASGQDSHHVHRISSPSELISVFNSVRDEASRLFTDPTVLLEHEVKGVRTVEVQVIADNYGTSWAVGVHDSTIQYKGRRIFDESGAQGLSPEQERELRAAALRFCQLAGFRSAGTVSFLYNPEQAERGDELAFWFLSADTSLSPAHSIIEVTTGLDLVKLQLDLARGGHLEGEPPTPIGHAIEGYLYAEDVSNGFAPSSGRIERFRLIGGPGLRIDRGYDMGNEIHPLPDPLLATITAWGRDQREARARLSRMLYESAIVIRGGVSNKPFLLDLLRRPEFDNNTIDAFWLDHLLSNEAEQNRPHADVALIQAAAEAYNAEQLVEQAQFYASAARGRPKARQDTAISADFRYRGQFYRLQISRLSPEDYRVLIDGKNIDARIEQLGPFERSITYLGQRYRVLSVIDGPDYAIEVEGTLHRLKHEEGGIIRAPSPAVVVVVDVAPGDHVSAGDRLAVIETMKMEMALTAPFTGRVAQLFVGNNVQVDAGAPLVRLESLSLDGQPISPGRVHFDTAEPKFASEADDPQVRCSRVLAALRWQVLGYDIDSGEAKRLLNELKEVHSLIAADKKELLRGENEILLIFADICSLFRRELDPAEVSAQDEQVHSAEQDLLTYLRSRDTRLERSPETFLANLQRALAHYGVSRLDPSPELDESLLLIYQSHQRADQQMSVIVTMLERYLTNIDRLAPTVTEETREQLDRLLLATQGRYPAIHELTREIRFRYLEEPRFEQSRNNIYEDMREHLTYLVAHPEAPDRDERMYLLVTCPQPMQNFLTRSFPEANDRLRQLMLEALTRRYYRMRQLKDFACTTIDGQTLARVAYDYEGSHFFAVTTFALYTELVSAAAKLSRFIEQFPDENNVIADVYLWGSEPLGGARAETEATEREIRAILNETNFPRRLQRILVTISTPGRGLGIASTEYFTYRLGEDGYQEDRLYRGFHLMMGQRLHIWRLANFKTERLPSVEDVYLFHGIARDNPKDERLFAIVEVRDATPRRDESGKIIQIPHLERMLMEALESIRMYQSRLPAHKHLLWNRVLLYVWQPLWMQPDEFLELIRKLWFATEGLGIERIVVRTKIADAEESELRDRMLHISNPGGRELVLRESPPIETPIATLSEYRQKVIQLRQRGLVYPYEIIEMLTPEREGIRTAPMPSGDFTEYDLDETNHLVPVDRPRGKNKAGIVVGVIRNYTTRYPEGMTRVLLLGDPSFSLGSISEPECRRVIEAVNLAERLQIPIEWFTLSAGAKIAMDSGTENMDWVSRTLRRITEFTQAGGEINIIVNGINVGAQPYWNSVSTMLMHTHGILIMTPTGAMVLTGKQSLDYSGGVSAEDNYGIGGYERIMGPNGQAQYFAPDLSEACQILMRHYEHAYVFPGERFPRRAYTRDPITRDVRDYPYYSTRPEDCDLTHVGDIFSAEKNAGRKRAFDIRTVMSALIDADHQPLERWSGMRDADMAVVWDAHIGGYPVAMLGIESRPIPRRGFVPGDGPEQWTAGTLFPMSAKKAARTINSTSGNRPLIVIANLSGFDGSPESLRGCELEYGAEIGRAIANFKGPIVFCVVSRYHGGSFVVFSKALNPNLEVAAVEGSYASVIGGVPAAAVVFAREVDLRTKADPQVKALQEQLAHVNSTQRTALQIQLNSVTSQVRSEKVGEVANEFDSTHNVQRAQRVGSIDHIIQAAVLRPYLVGALERGIQRELGMQPSKEIKR